MSGDLGCLFLWLALVPGLSAVDASWLGAYERLVGAVFVAWMVGLAVLIGFAGGDVRKRLGAEAKRDGAA